MFSSSKPLPIVMLATSFVLAGYSSVDDTVVNQMEGSSPLTNQVDNQQSSTSAGQRLPQPVTQQAVSPQPSSVSPVVRSTPVYQPVANTVVSRSSVNQTVSTADFNTTLQLANQGYAMAQARVGYMYYVGQGVRQDFAQAKAWYIQAANQGHASAMYNLGLMYATGEGVRQSDEAAKEWYGRACDNGMQQGCNMYRQYNQGNSIGYGRANIYSTPR